MKLLIDSSAFAKRYVQEYGSEEKDKLLTKEKAYTQISHSASLFKAILEFVKKELMNTSVLGQRPLGWCAQIMCIPSQRFQTYMTAIPSVSHFTNR